MITSKKQLTIAAFLIVGASATIGALYSSDPKEESKMIVTHASLAPLTKNDVLHYTDLVIIGTIHDIHAVKIPSVLHQGKYEIVSDMRVATESVLYNPKQHAVSEMILRIPGGQLGNEGMIVEGINPPKEGQKLLLFLKKEASGIFTLSVGGRGDYEIDAHGNVGVAEEEKRDWISIFGRNMNTSELQKEIDGIAKNLSNYTLPPEVAQ